MLRRFESRHTALYQFVGFSLVGSSALLVMLAGYYICVGLGLPVQLANLIGYILCTAYSYLLNFVFVFRGEPGTKRSAAVKFFALYLLLYVVTWFLVEWVVTRDGWGLGYQTARLLSPVINSTMITLPSFLASKFWVFRRRKN